MTRAVVRGGALLDEQGHATPVPPLDDHFSETPRLLLAIRGQLLVAWVGSDSPVVRDTSPFNRLEISTLREGSWRDSQTLMHGQRLRIGQPPAVRTAAADGDAVIAATFRDSTGRRARLAWKKGGTWRLSDWSGADYATHAYATPTADGGVVMLVMGSMAGAIDGVVAVRATWDELGISWSRPVVIDSLRSWYSDLAWARLGGDSILVVWYQSSDDVSRRGMITALTTDGGRQWRLTTRLTSRFAMDSPALAIDASSTLHMIYRAQPDQNVINEAGVIAHAVWRDDRWSGVETISQRASDTAPMIGSAPGGKLMAIWTEAVGSLASPSGPAPKSFGSIWTPTCR